MERSNRKQPLSRWLAGLQGLFYVATGAWPSVHLQSFLAMTGPKTDLWLVQAFGLVIAAFGLVLGYAAIVRRTSSALELAALVIAATLAFIDVYYVTYGAISKIYLLDAGVEAAIAAGWLLILGQRARRSGSLRSRQAVEH